MQKDCPSCQKRGRARLQGQSCWLSIGRVFDDFAAETRRTENRDEEITRNVEGEDPELASGSEGAFHAGGCEFGDTSNVTKAFRYKQIAHAVESQSGRKAQPRSEGGDAAIGSEFDDRPANGLDDKKIAFAIESQASEHFQAGSKGALGPSGLNLKIVPLPELTMLQARQC